LKLDSRTTAGLADFDGGRMKASCRTRRGDTRGPWPKVEKFVSWRGLFWKQRGHMTGWFDLESAAHDSKPRDDALRHVVEGRVLFPGSSTEEASNAGAWGPADTTGIDRLPSAAPPAGGHL